MRWRTIPLGTTQGCGRWSYFSVLNIANSKLTGSIPPSIVNLNRLMHLELSNNQISGELPSDLEKLSMMSRCLLNQNQLTGSIPASIARIYRLADLDISMNKSSVQFRNKSVQCRCYLHLT
ncbi:putative endo-polygalacturonase [Helianthus anomalus]